MLCFQYGEITFFGGLTASPAPLQKIISPQREHSEFLNLQMSSIFDQ